jgi:hypothetical protein
LLPTGILKNNPPATNADEIHQENGEGLFDESVKILPTICLLVLFQTIKKAFPFPKKPLKSWSWRWDSNPRPADYKSAALPTELHQQRCGHYTEENNFDQHFLVFAPFLERLSLP